MRISDWSSDVCSSDLNPAGVRRQLIGIARPDYVPIYAEALREIGTDRAMVISGEEGLDELSLAGGNAIAEIERDVMRRSEEHTSELQSLMRISYAVFCLKTNTMNKKQMNSSTHTAYPL